MNTRGLVAAGWTAFATVALAGTAGAQETTAPRGAARTADQPLIRRIPAPTIAIDAGAGVLGYTGGAAAVGPAWNVRVTGNFTPRFAGELSYTGAANEATRTDDTLVMTSIDAAVRVNLLQPDQAPVQPYVLAGVGYAGWAGDSGDGFAVTIPLAGGVERMLTRNIKIGARVTFKPAFADELGEGADAPGGDTWSVVGNVGGGF
jgi:hypothetical protein